MININNFEKFEKRHIGPSQDQEKEMLKAVGVDTLDALINETVPKNIRLDKSLNLPAAKTEVEYLKHIKSLADKNKVFKSYIGTGYYNCVVPGVIQRNILENPGWYTAYTPYQAEIAQGRLEALINFQTMISDLTGMELANASLLDEGTAAAEAMQMLKVTRKGARKKVNKFFVDQNTFPQTIDILKTRALPTGIELVIGDIASFDVNDESYYGLLLQYPNNDGNVIDKSTLIASANERGIGVVVATDLMSLALLTPPGEMGADVVIGTTQRFGVPMGYGGPHAAFFATKEDFKRQIPGRIIGASLDVKGNNAYRMALQTREQHIKRERATSNICTAQVLLGVMAGMFAVYHGPKGVKAIAERIHGLTQLLNKGLGHLGLQQFNDHYFDTLKVAVSDKSAVKKISEQNEINFRYFEDNHIGISLDETTTSEDVQLILTVLAEANGKTNDFDAPANSDSLEVAYPSNLQRTSEYLTHPVFNQHHSEHEMLRYIKSLENKDLSLVHSMISLGSCTMKLNATAEMTPITWSEFANIHPFVPLDQAQGYQELCSELETWLTEITGFAATSLQPNSGAQGEFAGLMVIKAYHESRGDGHRNITIIPSSAHGTNPASAIMAGQKVVITQCDEKGNIDVADLRAKAEEHKDNLAALMVTYPSTHGVFEESIKDICNIIHENGGQVYMDGANMNAQVGLTSPGHIGADVCHLNLHKTFCIPHGGGGPGIGPIGVAEQLKPFLPGNPVIKSGGDQAITAISSAPWGSAGILPISYGYVAMMGGEGLKSATEYAILNANYIKERLGKHFPILYTGKQGRCAHEMIVDCRDFKSFGVEVEDISKRLMDYGFHAPTVSFPVQGTLMIEPTESESLAELDRFCDALIEIRKEIEAVSTGEVDPIDNVLKNAPHTSADLTADEWEHSYTRKQAAYPLDFVKANKFWPTVNRIDNAYGDRNLICSCLPVEAFMEEEVVA